MFDKYYHIHEDRSEQAARIVDRGLERFGNNLRSISQDEIKARDRVDITLAEYERLKENVHKYEERCRRMGSMIIKLGIPAEVIDTIDPDSIAVERCDGIRDFKRHYRIRFTADVSRIDI